MSMIIVWRFFVELSFSFCDSDGAGLFAYRVLWLSAECDNGNNASSLLELICRLFPRCERANSKVKMLLHRKHSSAYTLTAKAVKTLNKKLQLATAVFSLLLSFTLSRMFLVFRGSKSTSTRYRYTMRCLVEQWKSERFQIFVLPHSLVWYSFQEPSGSSDVVNASHIVTCANGNFQKVLGECASASA